MGYVHGGKHPYGERNRGRRKNILYEIKGGSVFEFVVSNNAIPLTILNFCQNRSCQNGYIYDENRGK